MIGKTRVRFAPSPTGYLHVGNARTALFNWLLARGRGGTFVLRIEDTDKQRSTADATRRILDDLQWLGLDWDEGPNVGGPHGPYFQSQRREIYDAYFQKLLETGRAYKAFETPEELAAKRDQARSGGGSYRYDNAARYLTAEQIAQYESEGRPSVLRFRMPEHDLVVSDGVLGEVRVPAEELEDLVVRKSDGGPTYHFACVVDDAEMAITHVVRGQDHLMNTPKHLALQEAMGIDPPAYAHLPMILNMDGSKMSKREKDKAIKKGLTPPEIDTHDFRVAGFMPEALINFLALLGWSPGDDREIMPLPELIEAFSVDRIGKSNARFDRDKLRAFNYEYVRNGSVERVMAVTREFLAVTDYPLATADDRVLGSVLGAYRERSRTLVEMAEGSRFLFVEQVDYDPKAVRMVLSKAGAMALLADVGKSLGEVADWTEESLSTCLEALCEAADVKMGKVAQPIRVAVTGGTVSPPIYDTLLLLGRERTLERIRGAMGRFGHENAS